MRSPAHFVESLRATHVSPKLARHTDVEGGMAAPRGLGSCFRSESRDVLRTLPVRRRVGGGTPLSAHVSPQGPSTPAALVRPNPPYASQVSMQVEAALLMEGAAGDASARRVFPGSLRFVRPEVEEAFSVWEWDNTRTLRNVVALLVVAFLMMRTVWSLAVYGWFDKDSHNAGALTINVVAFPVLLGISDAPWVRHNWTALVGVAYGVFALHIIFVDAWFACDHEPGDYSVPLEELRPNCAARVAGLVPWEVCQNVFGMPYVMVFAAGARWHVIPCWAMPVLSVTTALVVTGSRVDDAIYVACGAVINAVAASLAARRYDDFLRRTFAHQGLLVEQLRHAEELREERDAATREKVRVMRGARKESERRVAQVEDRFGQLMGMVAHDLRNPLHGSRGLVADIIENTEVPGDASEDLRTVQVTLEQMGQLVDDLLDVQCIRAGKLRVRPQPFDLRKLVEEVVNNLREYAKVPVLVEAIDPTVPAIVVADPLRIRQLLNNGLSNAARATLQGVIRVRVAVSRSPAVTIAPTTVELQPLAEITASGPLRRLQTGVDGISEASTGTPARMAPTPRTDSASRVSTMDSAVPGSPTASTDAPPRYLTFEVIDSGTGLNDVDPETLFVAHKSGMVVQAKERSGFGLGLGLCRKVAESLGGRISLQERNDGVRGCRFFFSLPLREPRALEGSSELGFIEYEVVARTPSRRFDASSGSVGNTRDLLPPRGRADGGGTARGSVASDTSYQWGPRKLRPVFLMSSSGDGASATGGHRQPVLGSGSSAMVGIGRPMSHVSVASDMFEDRRYP